MLDKLSDGQKCHDISSGKVQESRPTARVAVLGPNVSGQLNFSHVCMWNYRMVR